MSAPFAITTDLRAGTTTCLSVTGATSLTFDGIKVIGGTLQNTSAFNYSGTNSIVFSNATIVGGSGGVQQANAIINTSTGIINFQNGCVVTGGSAGTGGTGNSNGINNNSTGTINVTGSCSFIGGSGASCVAFNNASTGTINVSGSCTFSASAATVALNNAGSGQVIVTNSTFVASTSNNAVSATNAAADVRLSGDFLDHWSGWKAVSGGKWRLGTAPTFGQTRYALAGTTDSYFTMYGADNGTFGNPIAANVRSGISYGGGNLTGTCAVPAAGSVSLGVPVDAGFGTAVLTPAAIRTELATELSRLDASVSSRLAPNGTLATVTTLTNAPTVPTPAQIASQVRTELSSELAKVAALNPTRLSQVTTTEILGNLLSQANS
jgi:hypothetical protein